MNKFVIITFPNESQAYEGQRALKELHAEGSIALFSEMIVVKDSAGIISVKEAASDGPLGTAVGALAGGLMGLLGGPVGAVVGLTGGALIGSLEDIFVAGVSADFAAKVADELTPGKTAIIAEISEDWVTPLDTRIRPLGGIVIRTPRNEIEEMRIAKEVASQEAEFKRLRTEYVQVSDEARASLETRIEAARASLEEAVKRAREKIDALRAEADAKVAALQEQAKTVAGETRDRIEHRITALRGDYERRATKLEQAWSLTKDALT